MVLSTSRGKQEAIFCRLERPRPRVQEKEETHITSFQCYRRHSYGCVMPGRQRPGLSIQGSPANKEKKFRSKRTKARKTLWRTCAQWQRQKLLVLQCCTTPRIFAQSCEDPPASPITNFPPVEHQEWPDLDLNSFKESQEVMCVAHVNQHFVDFPHVNGGWAG